MSLRPFAALLAALALFAGAPLRAADDFSPAERALFMSKHLANVKPPATLRYAYAKRGSMEPGFEDEVKVQLKSRPDKSCCLAAAEFLSGARRLSLPEVEAADGNPVVLYFLERDIREMNRLTKGQAAYFRKRIRMAVYQGAEIRELTLPYAGKTVAARQIAIAPYVDDPLRVRFENLAGKRYVFTLSDAVPGGVYAMSSSVAGAAGAPPLLEDELVIDGAVAPPRQP